MKLLQGYTGKILRPLHVANLRRVLAHDASERPKVHCARTARLGCPIGLVDNGDTVAKDDERLVFHEKRDLARLNQGQPFGIDARSKPLVTKDKLYASNHHRQLDIARCRPTPSIEIDLQTRCHGLPVLVAREPRPNSSSLRFRGDKTIAIGHFPEVTVRR